MTTVADRARTLLASVTGPGRAVAVLAVAAGAVGWFLGWVELTVVATTAVAALGVAVLFSLGRTELSVTVEVRPDRVVVGERAGGELLVRNAGRRRLLPVRLELPVGAGVAVFQSGALAPGATHDELFLASTARRAVITVGPVRSVRSDPLGLLRRSITWTEAQQLYVHPRITPLEQLGAGFLKDLEGQTTNDLSTNDVAFHTLREYVPGDDRRHVHWKTTARLGTMMVRQFVDTRQSHLAVLLATDPAEYADDDEFELAVSIAASLGVRALRDDQQVTMLAGAREVDSATGRRLLDGCAGVEADPLRGGLVHTASLAARSSTGASIVALVTGSAIPIGAVRLAALRLPNEMRILAVRACPSGVSGFRPAGTLTVANITTLDELAGVLRAVVRG
jgi:uncharacterized protein (DUF58 family)